MVDATEANQVTTAAASLLYSEIDVGVGSNATYTSEDFEPVLSRIAFDNEFANAGAKAYQLARGDDVALETDARNPLARALLYNIRDLEADGIDEQFDAVRTCGSIFGVQISTISQSIKRICCVRTVMRTTARFCSHSAHVGWGEDAELGLRLVCSPSLRGGRPDPQGSG